MSIYYNKNGDKYKQHYHHLMINVHFIEKCFIY